MNPATASCWEKQHDRQRDCSHIPGSLSSQTLLEIRITDFDSNNQFGGEVMIVCLSFGIESYLEFSTSEAETFRSVVASEGSNRHDKLVSSTRTRR